VTSLTLHFHGTFPPVAAARERIQRGVAFVRGGIVGEEGAFLPSQATWYPQEEQDRALYDVSITTPAGYEAVMEGEWVERSDKGKDGITSRWKTHHPLQGINLVIGRYSVRKESYRGVALYTFLFEKDEQLSRLYRDKSRAYLDLYGGLFPPYPFKKFAVVESFLPTGYGMPSFTLLGSAIIRLPFIPDTSLGHEIAHNWWGNSVFVDARLGNWSEALTSYTADHLYAERKGAGEALRYRKKLLMGYKNYAGPDAIALKDFIDSTSLPSRVVGYNKGTMLFHNLRRLLGDDLFYDGLKRFYKDKAFQKANWVDLQSAFEEAADTPLDGFFREWLDKGGGPRLALADVTLEERGGVFHVSLTIDQGPSPFTLLLPILFTMLDGEETSRTVTVKRRRERVDITLPERPLSLAVDPRYDLFRILSDAETPPTLGSMLGDRTGRIVLPDTHEIRADYREFAAQIARGYPLTAIGESELGKEDIRDSSLFILGGPDENEFFRLVADGLPSSVTIGSNAVTIKDRVYPLATTTVVISVKNPFNPAKVISALFGRRGELGRIARRLPHMTGKSYLAFSSDGAVETGIFEGEKVLSYRFQEVPEDEAGAR